MMEHLIEREFRKLLCTKLPIKVCEDDGEVIVVVGNQVYINVEPLKFCFVSDREIIHFSH